MNHIMKKAPKITPMVLDSRSKENRYLNMFKIAINSSNKF